MSYYDDLVGDAIKITYFELFNKYNYMFNNQTTRNKLAYDLFKGVNNKVELKTYFKVNCDESNNSPDIITNGFLKASVWYNKQNNTTKIYDLMFGDVNKISFPNDWKVYLRKMKINKIMNDER